MAKPPQIVGVVRTRTDLRRALGMRQPPDLFELRLDALFDRGDELEDEVENLRAPLIIAARHPREGGENNLSASKRRALLRRFLPYAAYVDVELRSAGMFAPILAEARARRVRTIISFHNLDKTPGPQKLDEIARTARSLGADFLKIATRTDTSTQLTRLLEFFQRMRLDMKIAAMGIGRRGRISRVELARRGSALNYGHLGNPRAEGQLSIAQLRHILR